MTFGDGDAVSVEVMSAVYEAMTTNPIIMTEMLATLIGRSFMVTANSR